MKNYFFILSLFLSFTFCTDEVDVKPDGNNNNNNQTEEETEISDDQINTDLFEVINLNYPGLEKVKEYYEADKLGNAAHELLNYYKNRTSVKHYDLDIYNISINKSEQEWAEDALEHKFYAHKGYPSYFYGDDINWKLWPVKDNELRWQLHRHYWWTPMGKVYRLTGDEGYAKEWALQYLDWIKKNPLIDKNSSGSTQEEKDIIENMRYAWRPLEVSHRLEDQTRQFLLFKNSEHFTPAFLSHFLTNFHKHGEHILANYSKQGNHLLFEAQRVINGGSFFPELKVAEKWRKSGVSVLIEEVENQVYDDGVQYELDPGYHISSINLFYRALEIADLNGFRGDFPDYYIRKIEKMIEYVYNITFPDYSMPCFSDANARSKRVLVRNFNTWQPVFPNNSSLKYFASEKTEGQKPDYKSNAFKDGGFYIFRTGWDKDATAMIVKAGPPAFWHNQPDNGTFELFINGRNFFPDSGSYIYGGDGAILEKREWFRQTRVHNTLTLNNKNIEKPDSQLLLWDISDKNMQKLVVENQSYKNLSHRRAVFFIDERFFVIVDEAKGDALGKVGVHYQLAEGNANYNKDKLAVTTNYNDNNNVVVKTYSDKPLSLIEEEGWVSYEYNEKNKRPAFVFEMDKNDKAPSRFITVIHPFSKIEPDISFSFNSDTYKENDLGVNISINGKKYLLNANW